MTREEALAGHRRLWNEIAEMIESGAELPFSYLYKKRALKNLGEKENIKKHCYLCEYSVRNQDQIKKWHCFSDCLVEWTGGVCENEIGEHRLFREAIYDKDYTQAAILARTIANLPERVVE